MSLTNKTSLEISSISNDTTRKDPFTKLYVFASEHLPNEIQEQRKKLIPLLITKLQARAEKEKKKNMTIVCLLTMKECLQTKQTESSVTTRLQQMVTEYPVIQYVNIAYFEKRINKANQRSVVVGICCNNLTVLLLRYLF